MLQLIADAIVENITSLFFVILISKNNQTVDWEILLKDFFISLAKTTLDQPNNNFKNHGIRHKIQILS